MAPSIVGIVTGANKGIGLAIVKQLAIQYPKSSLNKGSVLLYLTARDKSRGETAVASLKEDLGKAKVLAQDGGLTDIQYHQLDISESASIKSFGEYVKSAHADGVDFVINNAGAAFDGFNNDIVKRTLGCNYYGTLEVIRTFLPLMKPSGRIVNLASTVGRLDKYSDALQDRFRNPASVADVTKLMGEFADAVRRGKEGEEGWPSAAYAVSKAGVISMTRILAEELERDKSTVEVTCCCPGWVVTDMTKGRGYKTVDEGAQTPVLLALEGSGGRPGTFWTDEKIAEW